MFELFNAQLRLTPLEVLYVPQDPSPKKKPMTFASSTVTDLSLPSNASTEFPCNNLVPIETSHGLIISLFSKSKL